MNKNKSAKTKTTAEILELAISIAVSAHAGQRDRAGNPYILHPLRLMINAATVEERMAAVLHDVVEDTAWTLAALRRKGIPARVLAAVDCLTKREGEDYGHFIDRIAPNPLARRVKILDIEHNMDARRVPEFTPKDAERMTKYLNAWRKLTRLEARRTGH